ncbi:hypothetical protein ACFLYP_03720 [Chloroflexota bacterium]
MMTDWTTKINKNFADQLMQVEDQALQYFLELELHGQVKGTVENLWTLSEPAKLLGKQAADGRWRFKGKGPDERPYINYDLLETYRNLRVLIDQYGFTRDHPGIEKAAEYVFTCQREQGDIYGILGQQYMPYYMGALMSLLVTAGYGDDARIEKGFSWLLSVRQADGAWVIPMQTIPAKEKTVDYWKGSPILADREAPFSHLATGMVLRAFARHPEYFRHGGALAAAQQMKKRLFRADKYNDRKGREYWLKFQYPFWWPNLATELDNMGRMGLSADDPDIEHILNWFVENQESDGLWPTGYGKGRKAARNRRWVGLAVFRMLKFFEV